MLASAPVFRTASCTVRTPAIQDAAGHPCRRHPADHARAVGHGLLTVEGPLPPVKPWQMTRVSLSIKTLMCSTLFVAVELFNLTMACGRAEGRTLVK